MIVLKKRFRRIAYLTVAIIYILSMTVSAYAANNDINLNKKGSVFISLYDPDTNKPLNGGTLSIYKVADIELVGGEYVFVVTSSFDSGNFSLKDISSPSLADKIYDYIIDWYIRPKKKAKIKNGVATFSNLECGLYLVEQSEDTDGYYPINSFLVSLPMLIGGKYIYDINATPKVEKLSPWRPNTRPPNGTFDTEDPDPPPEYDPPGKDPEGDNPPGGINPGDDIYYDDETPPDIILETPEESNLVDFEKANITLKLFSADYSPAMKISLAILGVMALILIAILVYDKRSGEKKKVE